MGAPSATGPFPCYGLLTLNSQTHKLACSGMYWALAHYSKFMQRGGRVFATTGDLPDIDHIAVENPDGPRVLVLTSRSRNWARIGRSSACFRTNRSRSNCRPTPLPRPFSCPFLSILFSFDSCGVD